MTRPLSLTLAALALLLVGCASPNLKDYADQRPVMDLVDYFEGTTHAYGHFQDRTGKVRRRFEVTIVGAWDGSTLTLNEDFVYDDGETEHRLWTIQREGDGTWSGSADGVVGEATGEGMGNAFNWRYTFDLKTGDDKTLRVNFDDWLWRQDETRAINRAAVSKFGIHLGEVLLFFEKETTE